MADRLRIIKRISWGAVFGGTLVAIATELLFALWGFFIGFRLGPNGATAWSIVWWLVTAFCALFAGGWVAARLSGNPYRGAGGLHGLVTWGLTTVWTLLLVAAVAWGIVGGSLDAMRTAVLAANTAAPQAQAQVQQQAANAANQLQQNAPSMAQTAAINLSKLSVILFGGILLGAFASVFGGWSGRPKERELVA